MNQLSGQKQADILEDMVERKSLRGCARTRRGNSKTKRKGLSINTVYKLLEDAGDAAIQFLNDRMRDLPCRYVEADEVYCIVRMKPATLRERGLRIEGLGALWLWMAMDAESKLIITWHLGGSSREDAAIFMRRVRQALSGRIQLTTDSLNAYPEAVAAAFDEIDYATVKKRDPEEEAASVAAELAGTVFIPRRKRKKAGLPAGEKERPLHHLGEPDDKRATTNHIESLFQNLRKDMPRMTRRSSLISKTAKNLNRAVALYIVHHNFIKRHGSLKTKNMDGKMEKMTPAVAAGIDDDVWSWEDFVLFVDEFRSARRKAKLLLRSQPSSMAPALPRVVPEVLEPTDGLSICIYEQLKAGTCKIHLATCTHLRTDPGRAGTAGVGRKLYCDSVDAAHSIAEHLTPGRVTECRVCLGNYSSRETGQPRLGAPKPKLLK